RLRDARKRELLDELVEREDLLLVVVGPSHAHEEVDHRLGQIAEVAILGDRHGAVALRELPSARREDERYVRVARHGETERLEKQDLLRRVRQVILAANHMGDLHVVIVRDDGEVIDGRSVRARDHHVVDVLMVDGDGAADQVVELGAARRDLETHDGRLAGIDPALRLLSRNRRAQPVVSDPPLRGPLRFAELVETLLRAEARIGRARIEKPEHELAMPPLALALEVGPVRSADVGTFVPVETEVAKAIEDGAHGLGRRALAIGVLDAQDEDTALLPRVEPVEKRGSRPADVEVTGRRRGETDTNGLVGALLWGHGAGKPIPALAVSQAERRSGSTHRRAKKKEFTAGAPLTPGGRRRSPA